MNYVHLLLVLAMVLSGAALFILVLWATKRSKAKENGDAPPTLLQSLRGIIKPQDGGPGRPRPPA